MLWQSCCRGTGKQCSNTLPRVEGERAKTGLQLFLHKPWKSHRDRFLLPSRSFWIQEQHCGDQTQCPFFKFCLILHSNNCLWRTCGIFMQCSQWQWICFHNSVQLHSTPTLSVLLYLQGNPKVQNSQATLVHLRKILLCILLLYSELEKVRQLYSKGQNLLLAHRAWISSAAMAGWESLCFPRQHDWSICRHPMSAWTNIVMRKQAHRAHMSQTGTSRTQRTKGLVLTRHCDSVLTASSLSRAGKKPSCISVRIWFAWPTVTLCYSAKQKYPLPCQTTRDITT